MRHCEDIDSTCPDPEPSQLTSLAEVLGQIPDPRRVRGRRYRLDSLLALCLVAVLGGATSLGRHRPLRRRYRLRPARITRTGLQHTERLHAGTTPVPPGRRCPGRRRGLLGCVSEVDLDVSRSTSWEGTI
ncbi:transposase family protein [Streptomyces sp. NBC_00481]|uniref:transposase family protein n=1 Tax=Streptomyces sp. NBC_00481 TaxID=2975755 RepID=UPI003FA3B31C